MKKTTALNSKKILFLALNAKYSHTCLAIRYLSKRCILADLPTPKLLELTINNHLPDILGQVYEHRPDILCIACYIWNIQLVRELLPLLRRVLPNTIIICGGPEVSYDTEAFLRSYSFVPQHPGQTTLTIATKPWVDYVIRGEGESILIELLTQLCLEQKPSIAYPGLAFLKDEEYFDGGAVSLPELTPESLPFAYSKAELQELSERILYYETSRGCPFACAYCLSCATSGVRYRPWEFIRQELDLFTSCNVRQVKFVDRTFNAKKSHFLPILQYIQALPPKCRTNFHFELAVDYLDQETIILLQSMPRGRVQLEIGIQSTNDQVLQLVQRKNNWQKICSNIQQLLKNHNIHIHTDLIIGLPGEDFTSFAKSFNDVYSLNTDMLQLGFLKFLKGASISHLTEEFGYQYMDIAPYEVLTNSQLSYSEIHWLHILEKVFELYHNAGRCRNTCNFFIRHLENGNAFSFYQKLTFYWQRNGLHHQPHGAKALYRLLQDFLQAEYDYISSEPTVVDSLLRFDALLADDGKIRPEQLDWNLEKHQPLTARFWRNQCQIKVQDLLPDFQFTTWRDLRRIYQLEQFPIPVHLLTDSAISLQELSHTPVWLLFDYSKGDVTWQPLPANALCQP